MTHDFTAAERIALREHGIELFADRVIFDAQPPMSEAAIAAVQDVCAGPLPPALLTLWRQTAGGRLAYDLSIAVETDDGPRIEAISWCELSYNGNGRYRDLQGWIEHELELAEAMAEDEGCDWNGKLDCLPFGGFEYCDRIYAVTAPDAPDRGGIVRFRHRDQADVVGLAVRARRRVGDLRLYLVQPVRRVAHRSSRPGALRAPATRL